MKKLSLLALLPLLLISCSSSETEKSETSSELTSQNQVLELVDMRIYEDGKMKINGSSLSESALESHLDALPLDHTSKIRITSSDEVFTGLVHRTMREFVQRNIPNVTYNMMSKNEFKEFEEDLILDVLSNGRIMLDGHLLYPQDLSVALNHRNESLNDTEVRLFVDEMASMGTVTDIQKTLKKNDVYKISVSTNLS